MNLDRPIAGFGPPRFDSSRPDDGLLPVTSSRTTVRVYLVKPSKYDDDGSVLHFRWGVIPNNTLTVMAGLTRAWARTRPEVRAEIVIWDELIEVTITGGVLASIRDRAAADGAQVIFGLAGVQTNQYPRARDLALQARAAGLTVAVGGFHVSSHPPSRNFLVEAGVSVFVGESETTWPRALDDFLAGALAPCYRADEGIRARTGLGDITVPDIARAALPAVDGRYARRLFNPTFSTIDTSRGCPFVCSYCSVKNVMGRTMRPRAPDDVVAWVRDAYDRHGIRNLLVVDDDLFRSPAWEEVLGGIAELRRSRADLGCIIQVDIESAAHPHPAPGAPESAAHRRSRRFIELAAAAGCFEVFMGFESFSPRNLELTLKFHNEAREDRRRAASDPNGVLERVRERYRRVVANWHRAGVGVHAGYIIGLPFDEAGCGRRAARDLAEIGVDIASFFAYTPLPGTEDYDGAVDGGKIVDWDFNSFDSHHFVSTHPRLTPAELACEYRDAYRRFYRLRRVAWSLATGHRVRGLGWNARLGMLTQQIYFTYATRNGWHPMMGGIWRIRDNQARREVVTDEEAAERYLGKCAREPPRPSWPVTAVDRVSI